MTESSLDIILPCYNPPQGWVHNIIKVFNEIRDKIHEAHIKLIIVNDGSENPISQLEIDQLEKNIPDFYYLHSETNNGKGHALRLGVKESRAKFCIYTDIDFPYTTASFIKIWQQLNTGGTDVAAGVKNDSYYKHVPQSRRIISKILRSGSKFILRLKVSDTQCGLKGFNNKGKALFLKTTINRYLFDLEFIFLASKNNDLNVHPVEIELKENIQFRSMRFGVLLDEGINFVKILFKSL